MHLVGYGTTLNSNLVKIQNLSQEQVDKVLRLHGDKFFLFQQFDNVPTMTQDEIHELVLEVEDLEDLEDLEYFMQEAWGFPESKNHHTHWYEVLFCCCSNTYQGFGKPKRYDPDCIVHVECHRD